MKIVSWNVNGLLSCLRKGFLRFLVDAQPDIICCQEIKTKCSINAPGYIPVWNPAQRPGYSGTLVLTKQPPISYQLGIGIEEFDDEGRLIALEYESFYVVNVYAPSLNPHSEPERPAYRNRWDTSLRDFLAALHKPAIICGDFNVARAYIDSYPENQKNEPDNPLFQSEIRGNFEQLLSLGFIDVFRALFPEVTGAYTWWGPKNNNRAENRGSRLDYFLVSENLLPCVQSIKFNADTLGSDHCPISMCITPTPPKPVLDDEDLAAMWRNIDWEKMNEEVFERQAAIAEAAYYQKWDQVQILQDVLVRSWSARVISVQAISKNNSAPGVDGIKWETDEERIKAAISLNSINYEAHPYRHIEIEEKGKTLPIDVPVAQDKAMQYLWHLALDPVAESTADRRSFFCRRGRSLHDLHAYLERDIEQNPELNLFKIIDVKSFYFDAIHKWFLENIPMNKGILRQFLNAGVVSRGDLFHRNAGITYGSSLSPNLANMMLDGLQSKVYDGLYKKGHGYKYGIMTRWADDMIFSIEDEAQGEQITQIVSEFLAERGLRLNDEKSRIVDLRIGFDFLGRHYKRGKYGLEVTPASKSTIKMEHELENLILGFRGTQRRLIEIVNEKLSNFSTYYRAIDAFWVFRHIDAVVEGLLLRKMREKYSHWKPETVRNKFWIREPGGFYVMALPKDPSIRIMRLAPLRSVRHKPCKLSLNPYLEPEYATWLKERRDIQKANGKYKAVWNRQGGKCAFCKQSMLIDQELDVVEKIIGKGRNVRNLIYIHRQCAYDTLTKVDDTAEPLDFYTIVEDYLMDAPLSRSPYLELTEFFRMTNKTPFSLTFKEIEKILGDQLPWESKLFQAFWFDDTPGYSSPMWEEEKFPLNSVTPTIRDYCICDSWTSQGYAIKALHMEEERVVFRRIVNYKSGLIVPKELMSQKLPDAAIYECQEFFRYIVKRYGL